MTAANVTSDPSVLEFGNMWVEGGFIAKLTQRLCVEVKNTSDKDFYGVWIAVDEEQEASVKISGTPLSGMREFTEIQVPTNSTATIEIYVCAPRAGKYKIICANVEPKQVLFNYELDVVEYQEPQVSGSLKLNMLEQTSEGNVLYCDTYLPHISGTIQITNDGENSLISYLIREFKTGNSPQLTKCEQMWDYLYADDAATALLLLAESGTDGGIYPIGSGTARPLREYIETVRDIIDPKLPLGFGEVPYAENQVMHLCADISKLKEDTGFTPQVSFREGARRTADFVRVERAAGKMQAG
jgi:hypothetical protein